MPPEVYAATHHNHLGIRRRRGADAIPEVLTLEVFHETIVPLPERQKSKGKEVKGLRG
jgi:hypothetical protein